MIGTDAHVDRRLPADAEVEIPFYPGLSVGVPGVTAVVDRARRGPLRAARDRARAGRRGRHARRPACSACRWPARTHRADRPTRAALQATRASCSACSSRSARSTGSAASCSRRRRQPTPTLAELGLDAQRIGRWDRGVDLARFTPAKRDPDRFPADRVAVLYAGRLTRENGVDLLADDFLAGARDPRLQLVLAGGEAEEDGCAAGSAAPRRSSTGSTASSSPRPTPPQTCSCSARRRIRSGRSCSRRRPSGLPVVAVAAGGPAELIADGRSGLLCAPRAEALAGAVAGLAGSRRRGTGSSAAGSPRCGSAREASLGRLAAGWHRALAGYDAGAADRRAA